MLEKEIDMDIKLLTAYAALTNEMLGIKFFEKRHLNLLRRVQNEKLRGGIQTTCDEYGKLQQKRS
jgi:hypothetical protein